jgi:PAS domain S-box-containing protein
MKKKQGIISDSKDQIILSIDDSSDALLELQQLLKPDTTEKKVYLVLENLSPDSKSKLDNVRLKYPTMAICKADEIVKIEKDTITNSSLSIHEEHYHTLFETMAEGVIYLDSNEKLIAANPAAEEILGFTLTQITENKYIEFKWKTIHEDGSEFSGINHPIMVALKTGKEVHNVTMGILNPRINEYKWIKINAVPQFREGANTPYQAFATFNDITELKIAKNTLQKRITSLTLPLVEEDSIEFKDLFNIEDIQKLQDEIANVTGVASIITLPDGRPITKPSNFCRLCNGIIRKTKKGLANCYKSDSVLGCFNAERPTIQKCLSGGLWDAGSGISVGGKHIANWLVGQIRDENQTEEEIRAYAKKIDADEEEVVKAFYEVKPMSQKEFEKIANLIFTLSNQLSSIAYQNVQQARFISDKERSVISLQESEEKFRAAFKITPDSISISRITDGKYIDINDGFEETSGYKREEIIGKTSYDINIWNDEKDRDILVETLKKQGYINNLEAIFNLKDNKKIIALMSARILNINGEPHLLAITRDITEKKKVDEAIKKAAKEWQDTFDSTADAICLLDTNQKILRVNKAMLKAFNLEKENIFEKHCWEIVHKSNEPIHGCVVISCLKSHKRESMELEINSKVLFVTADPILDENGEITGIVHIIRDISEQKKVEKSLIESEERYRTVVSSSSEGIILQDNTGKILTWNKAAEKIFGIRTEDVIGETSISRNYNTFKEDGTELKGEEHPSMITLKTGKPCYDVLMKVIRNNQEYSWVKVNTNPVFIGNDSNPSFVVISFSDITTLKETQEKLKNTEEKVRKKLDAILMPEGDIGQLELADIINTKEIQALMNDFYNLTHIGIGIIDLKGIVLVGTGWQEICTDYHRVNSISCQNCIESDLILTQNIDPGSFKLYKCKNNMWDIATPIMLAGKHIGNLFLGQFLFEDEKPDTVLFEEQALKFGFNKKSYIEALEKVPRWNHETIKNTMSFYTHFSNMISNLSYSNIKLAQTIAENERTNIKLQEREEIFSTIVNQANDAIALINPDTAGFVEFNNMAHEMYGYTREEFKKMTLIDIEAEMDKKIVFKYLKNLIKSGGQEFETKHKHKDGTIKDIRVSSKLVNIKGKAYITGMWSDITFNKKQQALLKDKDLIFESLLNNSPIYVFFKDHNIKAVHLSKNFEQMIGMPISEAIGKDMNELFPSELALNMIADDKKIIHEGKLVQVEEELNGRFYTTIKFPIYRENSSPMLAGFTIDITEQKKAEIEIKELNQNLEKRVEERTSELTIANKELEAFAYTVSHDLRAPLRAIDGFTKILTEDYTKNLDDKGKRLCKTISENALKMGQLIDDLLSFSRIGRNELNYSTFNMKNTILSVCQNIFTEELRDKFQLIIGEMPTINGDKNMYNQVWVNLISNAFKFSFNVEKPVIEIKCEEKPEEYIFSIKDNGAGFDMKYSEKLFGVFERLHSTKEYEGTGVGLAIVQRVINRHGGKIWAISEVNKGAEFYFTVKK